MLRGTWRHVGSDIFITPVIGVPEWCHKFRPTKKIKTNFIFAETREQSFLYTKYCSLGILSAVWLALNGAKVSQTVQDMDREIWNARNFSNKNTNFWEKMRYIRNFQFKLYDWLFGTLTTFFWCLTMIWSWKHAWKLTQQTDIWKT